MVQGPPGCRCPGTRVGNSFRSRHQEPQTPQRPDCHLRHGHFVFWLSLALGETTPRWAPSLKVMEREGRAHRPSHPAWSDSAPGVKGRRELPSLQFQAGQMPGALPSPWTQPLGPRRHLLPPPQPPPHSTPGSHLPGPSLSPGHWEVQGGGKRALAGLAPSTE